MSSITIHKVIFSAPARGLEHTEYVLGTWQQAEDYATGEASNMGTVSTVYPVHIQGSTIQVKELIESEIIRILCN